MTEILAVIFAVTVIYFAGAMGVWVNDHWPVAQHETERLLSAE